VFFLTLKPGNSMKKTLLLLCSIISFATVGQDKKWVEPGRLDTTLTFSERLAIKLSSHPAFDMEDYVLPIRIEDSLTASLEYAPQKALAIETYQISKIPDLVKRKNDLLSVKLKNSHWLTLQDDDEEPGQWYSFEYYFGELGFYSIRVMYAEGYGFLLVNANTGEITNLIGRPYFSADGTRLIAVGNDIEANNSVNGFQLLQNDKGALTTLGSYDPAVWGCKSALWLNNETLVLKNESIETKGDEMKYFDFFTKLEIR
jgi:hypothetical protein